MAVALLEFRLKNYELAHYQLSKYANLKGYKADVIVQNEEIYTLIYENEVINDFLSNPIAIKISYVPIDNKTKVILEIVSVKTSVDSVVKGIISVITVIPGIIKLTRINPMKNKIKKIALKVAFDMKEE